MPPPEEDIEKWEAQFSQLMNAQRDELDEYGTNMQNSWEGGLGNHGELKPMQFDTEGIPLLGDYIFGEISYITMSCSHTVRRENQQIRRPLILTLTPE